MPSSILFCCTRSMGEITLRPMQQQDLPLIHHWVSQPYARFWGMQSYTLAQLTEFYSGLVQTDPHAVLIGCCDGKPVFLIECYQAQNDAISQFYPAKTGDYGMHLLIAPAEIPQPSFSWQVFTCVMDYLFSRPEVERVVVEPDVGNHKIHRLNKRAGFQYHHLIEMGHKTAWLAFCQRGSYEKAKQRALFIASDAYFSGQDLVSGHWENANRLLIRKALCEFSHERLLAPERLNDHADNYCLRVPKTSIEYHFRAERLALDHWLIDAGSISKWQQGKPVELDTLRFIIEFQQALGIAESMMATYMEEITSTLRGAIFKRENAPLSSEALADADFQTLEAAMTEGHPCFVANNGRLGFDARDYLAYAPEVAASVRLLWVALHRQNAHFASIDSLTYSHLMQEELGETTLAAFRQKVFAVGADPDDYLFSPVHPWQWNNKILTVFAPDIAARNIIYLGEGEECYQVQQSLRTFFNHSSPGKRYVKTALSVLNMGFMRGLSPYYMATTPAVNQWVTELLAEDPWLKRCDFRLLREVASIGYHNRYYEQALQADSPYKKMFAALWRDNPMMALKPGQRLMTMAALLHRDADQQALLPILIRRSGLEAIEWIQRYLRCYLSPLLHCFWHHQLVFMPHGENLILLMENHIPVAAYMKDIGEEIAVLDPLAVLPEKAQRVITPMANDDKVLWILSDVFDGFFRFVSAILHESDLLPQQDFWRCVADCISEYQLAHPELAEAFRSTSLFVPTFKRSCLNRLQLANNQQMIMLSNQAENLKIAGSLVNPIAVFAPLSQPEKKHVTDL